MTRRGAAHRLSRNDGRPGQDAAPEGARRPAGGARRPRACGGDAASTASGRSICWWSISIRSRRRSRTGAALPTAIENIDIGGPAMIRAAAKNHADVAVIVDPEDYGVAARRTAPRMMARPVARTAPEDSRPRPMRAPPPMTRRSRNWFAADSSAIRRRLCGPSAAAWSKRCATARTRIRRRRSTARGDPRPGVATRTAAAGQAALLQQHQRHRRGLSNASAEFDPRRALRLRHRQARQPVRRRRRRDACWRPTGGRLRCDPVSAFGGIVAVNRTLDAEAAAAIVEIFTEVIIAPDASDGGDAIIAGEEEPAAADRRRPARSARRRARR